MTITKTFINRLVKTINNSSELTAHGTGELMSDYDEFVIRYEDLNGYKISIYFDSKDDECHIAYFDHNDKYHWFRTVKNLSEITENVFMMDISICLYRMSNYAENAGDM